MKKVFATLAIVGFLAACNTGANSDAQKDSLNAIDSTKNAMKDSVEVVSDSAKAAIDSAAKAAKDTIKSKM